MDIYTCTYSIYFKYMFTKLFSVVYVYKHTYSFDIIKLIYIYKHTYAFDIIKLIYIYIYIYI